MKKVMVKILIFLIIIFIVNIIFYYANEDYKFFIKKIKNPERIVYTEEKEITDEYKIENIPWIAIVEDSKNDSEYYEDYKNKEISEKENYTEKYKWNTNNKEKKIYLWEKYRDIIKLFGKYKLKEIEIKYNLFDVTEEYPDNYFEYYSKNLTLYLFPTKSYKEIKDIFEVVSYESSFSLNELNNFWNNSFYINLDEEVKDSFVRIIVNNKNIVFWLKIKKDVYNEAKEILNNELK